MNRRLIVVAVMLVVLAVVVGCVPKPKKTEVATPVPTEAQRDSADQAQAKSDLLAHARHTFADSTVKMSWEAMSDPASDDHFAELESAHDLVNAMNKCLTSVNNSDNGVTWKDVGVTEDHAKALYASTARRYGRQLLAAFAVPVLSRPEGFETAWEIADAINDLQQNLYSPTNVVDPSQVRAAVLNDLRARIRTRKRLCADELKGIGGAGVLSSVEDRFTNLKKDLRWAVDTYGFTAPKLGLTAMELDLLIRDLSSEKDADSPPTGGSFSGLEF
ncbi:MAG: hypothetical protein V1907_01120 [Candidatus Kerfeldbacteria bacterium]